MSDLETVFQAVKKHPDQSQVVLSRITNLPLSRVKELLHALVAMGRIEKVGALAEL